MLFCRYPDESLLICKWHIGSEIQKYEKGNLLQYKTGMVTLQLNYNILTQIILDETPSQHQENILTWSCNCKIFEQN